MLRGLEALHTAAHPVESSHGVVRQEIERVEGALEQVQKNSVGWMMAVARSSGDIADGTAALVVAAVAAAKCGHLVTARDLRIRRQIVDAAAQLFAAVLMKSDTPSAQTSAVLAGTVRSDV